MRKIIICFQTKSLSLILKNLLGWQRIPQRHILSASIVIIFSDDSHYDTRPKPNTDTISPALLTAAAQFVSVPAAPPLDGHHTTQLHYTRLIASFWFSRPPRVYQRSSCSFVCNHNNFFFFSGLSVFSLLVAISQESALAHVVSVR